MSLARVACGRLASDGGHHAGLRSTLDEGFGRAKAHPCPTTELFSFCGTGTITGFGEATSVTEVVIFENFDPATSCADVVLRRTITLEDGSTLVLMETGTVCFPGKSTLAPGAAKSFGNHSTSRQPSQS